MRSVLMHHICLGVWDLRYKNNKNSNNNSNDAQALKSYFAQQTKENCKEELYPPTFTTEKYVFKRVFDSWKFVYKQKINTMDEFFPRRDRCI